MPAYPTRTTRGRWTTTHTRTLKLQIFDIDWRRVALHNRQQDQEEVDAYFDTLNEFMVHPEQLVFVDRNSSRHRRSWARKGFPPGIWPNTIASDTRSLVPATSMGSSLKHVIQLSANLAPVTMIQPMGL
jgi:hypothetical protein